MSHFIRSIFLFVIGLLFSTHCWAECDGVLCVEGGNLRFDGSFVQSAEGIGMNVSGATETVDSFQNAGGEGAGASDEGLREQLGSDSQNEQASSDSNNNNEGNDENQGGNQGVGQAAGAANFGAGLNDIGGDSSLTSSDNEFGQNNFASSDDDSAKSRKPIETSKALGEAINEQGLRDTSGNSNNFNENNSGGGRSDNNQIAAYNGAAGGLDGGGVSASGKGRAYSDGGDQQDNGIVDQAKKFFKGAFGIGGRQNGGRGKAFDKEVRKRQLAQLAAKKTLSPAQVIKEKWRRMRAAGLVGRRGIASTAPRGMLDARVNIFHGMCKEYSSFASQIGSADAGYCPPSK